MIYDIKTIQDYKIYIKFIFCNTDHFLIFVNIVFNVNPNIKFNLNQCFLSSFALKFEKTKNDEFLGKAAVKILKEFKDDCIIRYINNQIKCTDNNRSKINKICDMIYKNIQ